jgi:hypothetical protein
MGLDMLVDRAVRRLAAEQVAHMRRCEAARLELCAQRGRKLGIHQQPHQAAHTTV